MTTYTAMTAGGGDSGGYGGFCGRCRGSLWSRTPGHAQPSGTLPGRQSGNASPFSEGGCGRRGRMVCKKWGQKQLCIFLSVCADYQKSDLHPGWNGSNGAGAFLFLTTVGSLIWNTVLICAGAAAGASWERVMETVDAYSNTAVWAAAAAILAALCIHRRGKKRAGNGKEAENGKKINPCFTWRLPDLTGI